MENIKKALAERFGERFKQNEPMSAYTTFKTGGAADLFLEPSSAEEIIFALELLKDGSVPYIIIGKGSNLLVSDDGFRGAVIKLGEKFSAIGLNGTTITAQSGASMASVAALALKNGLTGLEFAAGIPGSVGGGVCMNAGAYGGELKDIIKTVSVLKDGEIKTLKCEECGFGYRSSRIMREKMIALGAEFELQRGDYSEISAKMKDFAERRISKQPLEYPSAGSTFKRPEGYFAGKLIEDSGLKGFGIGAAQVSEKHCGFIINKGGAASSDIYDLISAVQKKVFDKFGVRLETEVRLVGKFD